MDGNRFDDLTKWLAVGTSRRLALKGLAGGAVAGLAALTSRSRTDARRVTQAHCGNVVCADDPSVCNDGCVCCEFSNGNNRCMPPRDCQRHRGEMICTGYAGCTGGNEDQRVEIDTDGLACAPHQLVFACCPNSGPPDLPQTPGIRGCCTPGVDCPDQSISRFCAFSECDFTPST